MQSTPRGPHDDYITADGQVRHPLLIKLLDLTKERRGGVGMESQSKSRIGKQKLSKYITLERVRGLQWERDALTIHSASPPPSVCRALDMDEHIHHRTAQAEHS